MSLTLDLSGAWWFVLGLMLGYFIGGGVWAFLDLWKWRKVPRHESWKGK